MSLASDSFLVPMAIAVATGVSVRPSVAGAVAAVALCALAAVYRRQASVDRRAELEASDRARLATAEKQLEAVQKEFAQYRVDLEPMKLDFERRKLQR